MEIDPKEFMRVQAISPGELSASNEDGPITLPLLECWIAPAFADENAPVRLASARPIRLVLDRQLLSEIARWIQDLGVEPQSQGQQSPAKQ